MFMVCIGLMFGSKKTFNFISFATNRINTTEVDPHSVSLHNNGCETQEQATRASRVYVVSLP